MNMNTLIHYDYEHVNTPCTTFIKHDTTDNSIYKLG